MTSQRWRQIELVYHAALEREPQARAQYVAAACGADEDLRKEVESLLATDASSPGLVFNRPTVDLTLSATGGLIAGAQLGPYVIESQLGAGGMAEVWKARDTRLGRLVALKISKTDFSRRFELEARTVAALNHPHICTLYDVGPNYLVMECINGKPLQELIPRKGLPLTEALNYAGQIADALAAAHTAGIVHRDLKPGNIMVTAEASVKVVDFGLARVAVPEFQKPDDPDPLTAQGQIVGTVSYMSPEQAEGKSVDARSDVFSFGSVLYEMLTGERAFRGNSPASTLGNIIHNDPRPAREISGPLPRDLETLLSRCLRKDPARRWQSMADVRVALLDLKEDSAARQLAPGSLPPNSGYGRSIRSSIFPWTLAAAAIIAAAALAVVHFRQPPPEREVLRYTLPFPDRTSDVREFVISPDGHFLVMDAGGEGSPSRLWLRALDSLAAQPLAGTEEATYPFWSPDNRWIAFFSRDKLKKIPVNGGPVQTLCDAPIGRGGAWSRSGVIVFAADNGNNGLSRVSETGGAPAALTKVDTGTHRWPWFLPDGRHFLYMSARGRSNGIHLASLDSQDDKRLVADESNPAYRAPSAGDRFGFLLFVRERTLMSQPVDPKTLEAQGELVPVAEQVSQGYDYGSRLYSLSGNGVLVYQTGRAGEVRQYTWFDRTGKEVGHAGGAMRSLNSFSVSPNGRRVAIERPADSGSGTDLWLMDLAHDPEHGAESRFTFDASLNSGPVWSPDGSRIAFESNRGDGNARLYQRLSNNTGPEELLFESKFGAAAEDWSRDGKYLIFRPSRGPIDLWALPLAGERKPIRLVATPGVSETDTMGQLSPDGKWLAYTTNASGLFQVMVQPFAPAYEKPSVAKWQISTAGGAQPRWRGDGKELYYMAPDGKLMAVEVKATPESFEHGAPRALFASRADAPTGAVSWSYVPSPDGNRFLIRTPRGASAESPVLTVVVNWPSGAKK
jgi:serine/threonine protein kinase/Tol biopolymer transport system component